MNDQEFRELDGAIGRIWELAQTRGLDAFPIHFEVVPASIMYEFGAYGLPGRFSHWTHGRAYHHMKTMYDYGLERIYELVINTNPAYAFLLENNGVLPNKVVAAHVVGHVDFFKNNVYFSRTNRQMLDIVSTHADRMNGYEFEHGKAALEELLDAALAVSDLIDSNVFLRQAERKTESKTERKRPATRSTPYDDLFQLDAPPVIEAASTPKKSPPEPVKDVLGFLARFSPALKNWERDVLQIIRDEQLYFLPQMQTKIMNEGWASYWHVRLMRDLDLSGQETIDFAHMHSGVIATSRRRINPYHLGLKIFEDIERRWNGEYEDAEERALVSVDPRNSGVIAAQRANPSGKSKIFEVREIENDVSFLRNYLTKKLVDDLDLYIYEPKGDKLVIVEKDWERVRDIIVGQMNNFGSPYIMVEDADYGQTGQLLLKHYFEGQKLDLDYAKRTLRYIQRLWGRPVLIETVVDGKTIQLRWDGNREETVQVN